MIINENGNNQIYSKVLGYVIFINNVLVLPPNTIYRVNGLLKYKFFHGQIECTEGTFGYLIDPFLGDGMSYFGQKIMIDNQHVMIDEGD